VALFSPGWRPPVFQAGGRGLDARCRAAAAAATADRYQLSGALRRAYTLARAGPPAVSMTDRQPN